MKNRLSSLAIFLTVSGLVALPAIAANSQSASNINSIQAEIDKLQREVQALKNQIKQTNGKSAKTGRAYPPVPNREFITPTSQSPVQSQPSRPVPTPQQERIMANEEVNYLPFDLDVPGQAFVSTGPYVGVPIQYAGTNLIINSPSVNTDLQLLAIRKNIMEQLNALHGEDFEEPYHSHLLLSGLVEAQALYINNSAPENGGNPSTDIDLTNVSLDFTFLGPSDWLLGFVELTYDNAIPAGTVYASPSEYRVANSRMFINKAFFTIGNLSKSPVYGTVGQFYVPFGAYSSAMVSAPFTQSLTRTKARAIEAGFQQQGDNVFYGSAFIFRGDSHASTISKIANGGLNLGYKFSRFERAPISANIGASVIGNIADSVGMQFGNNFQNYEQIVHRVPGYNVRGNFSFGEHTNLIFEYVGASTRFNMADMSYNNHGAKPSAFDIEGAYSFSLLDKPSSVAVGYQKSNQAMSLNLPLTRTSLVFSTSWWRNTLQSLEFRRDKQYAASDVATSAGGNAVTQQTGKGDNVVTAQFDYYF